MSGNSDFIIEYGVLADYQGPAAMGSWRSESGRMRNSNGT